MVPVVPEVLVPDVVELRADGCRPDEQDDGDGELDGGEVSDGTSLNGGRGALSDRGRAEGGEEKRRVAFPKRPLAR
jgi:hypothetical protein